MSEYIGKHIKDRVQRTMPRKYDMKYQYKHLPFLQVYASTYVNFLYLKFHKHFFLSVNCLQMCR